MTVSPDIMQAIQTAATAYGANPNTLSNIARLESGYNTGMDPNTWDSNAQAGHPSVGMFQFIPSTFNEYATRARTADPAAWNGLGPNNIGNWHQQALATAYAITHGGQGNWSTYQRAASGNAPQGAPAGVGASPGLSAGGGASAPDPLLQARTGLIDSVFANDPVSAGLLDQHLGQMSAPAAPSLGGHVGSSPIGADTSNAVVRAAVSHIGQTAQQAAAFARANGMPFDSQWCGDYVQSVFHAAGLPVPPARSVPALLSWAEHNHSLTHSPTAGNAVMFDWNGDGIPDHVGIVTGTQHGQISEVGGNQHMGSGYGVTQDTFAANDPNILGYVNAA